MAWRKDYSLETQIIVTNLYRVGKVKIVKYIHHFCALSLILFPITLIDQGQILKVDGVAISLSVYKARTLHLHHLHVYLVTITCSKITIQLTLSLIFCEI